MVSLFTKNVSFYQVKVHMLYNAMKTSLIFFVSKKIESMA